MIKILATAAAALFLTGGAHAQASAPAPSSPAKKELVAKLLKAQQPGVEQLARQLVEQPALQLMQRANAYIQARVPAEQREAMARDVQADARKYVDETYPLVRDRALKLQPQAVGPVLEQNLTEAELRQVLAVYESAAWRKFQGLGGEMQKALGEKLVADVKGQVEPKVRALDQVLAKRLGISETAPASAASAGK